jgi:oligogalacturonide lyase
VAKGARLPSEAKKFDDERALKPTIQLTDNGSQNRHLGLSVPTFANQGRKLIYVSDRDGSPNFYLMDLLNFQSTELTSAKGIFTGGAWYSEKARQVFYWERTTLKSVNIDTLEEKLLYNEGYQGSYLSASPDGRYAAFGARCEDVAFYSEEFNDRWALMVVSAEGEGAHPALEVPFPISRVQFSPADPDKILFSWDGPSTTVPQRIWSTDVGGLSGGPLGRQNPNEAREDEFYTASGERIGYHGMRYRTRNDNGKYFIEETAWIFGLVKPDGSGETQFEVHGPTGQCQMNHGEDILVCSAGGAMERGNQSVSLLRPVGRGGAVFDPLFYHGAKDHIQWICPQFRPGDEDVIFTTDFSGHADIFLSSLN